jgi:hypothetical protein
MSIAGVTNSQAALWIPPSACGQQKPRDLRKADVLTVIHFSTASLFHRCAAR